MCMACVNGAEVWAVNYTLRKDPMPTGTTLQPFFTVVKVWGNYSIIGIIQQDPPILLSFIRVSLWLCVIESVF